MIQNDIEPKIICVDLDGTLIKNDVTQLSIKRFISKNPLNIFLLFFWNFRGKAYLKHKIAKKIDITASDLDYFLPFLMYLEFKKQEGYKLYLATASNIKYAENVACHTKIFEGVFASDKTTDLKGARKAKILEETFGIKGFIYAGNSVDDIPIWNKSFSVIAVSPEKALKSFLKKIPHELIGEIN